MTPEKLALIIDHKGYNSLLDEIFIALNDTICDDDHIELMIA